MLYVLTSDLYFYNGLRSVYGCKKVLQISHLMSMKEKNTMYDSLLIDTLCCPMKNHDYIYLIQDLTLSRVIFMSSFSLSSLKSLSPVIFIPRSTHPAMLSLCPEIFVDNSEVELPVLTLMEHEIISMVTNSYNEIKMASSLGITVATLRAHKFQLMLKLKLKKMSHIIYTEHYAYINR